MDSTSLRELLQSDIAKGADSGRPLIGARNAITLNVGCFRDKMGCM